MARSSPLDRATEAFRTRLVSQVRATFNDVEGGQEPVPPSDEALFERDSPIRLVHADVVGMMVGGVRSLLLQMLHPHALHGVLDHSDFRADMHGRLRRTRRARFILQEDEPRTLCYAVPTKRPAALCSAQHPLQRHDHIRFWHGGMRTWKPRTGIPAVRFGNHHRREAE